MLPLLALLSSRLTVIADETPPTPKLACTVPYWCEPDPQRVLNITHDVKFDDVEGHPLLLDLYDPGAPECSCEGTLSAIMLCCTERAPMCHFNAQRSQCAVNRTASGQKREQRCKNVNATRTAWVLGRRDQLPAAATERGHFPRRSSRRSTGHTSGYPLACSPRW